MYVFLPVPPLVKAGGRQFITYFITTHLVDKDSLSFSTNLKLLFLMACETSSIHCAYPLRVTYSQLHLTFAWVLGVLEIHLPCLSLQVLSLTELSLQPPFSFVNV